MEELKKSHITSADYIRAIASLAVALFHLGGKALPVLKYGWLGVELFFVLSGFIICWSMPSNYSIKSFFTFLKKRIVRIEPPYIASIFLALLIFYITNANYTIDWKVFLLHLGYLPNFLDTPYYNVVYWTLGIEFQYYLIIALFFSFLNKSYSKYILIISCIISSFININGNTIITYIPFFALGMYTFLYRKKLITSLELLGYVITITLLNVQIFSGIQLLAGLFTVTILLLKLPKNSIVTFFAKISFSLYLTHDLVGSNLVVFLGTILPKTVLYKAIIFTTGISVSILFALLFFMLFEKPFLNLSKKIKYRYV